MKKQLKLNELRIKSFVTEERAQLKGGAPDHSVNSKDFVCFSKQKMLFLFLDKQVSIHILPEAFVIRTIVESLAIVPQVAVTVAAPMV